MLLYVVYLLYSRDTRRDKRQKALRSYIGIDCSVISVLKHAHNKKIIYYYLFCYALFIIIVYIYFLAYTSTSLYYE